MTSKNSLAGNASEGFGITSTFGGLIDGIADQNAGAIVDGAINITNPRAPLEAQAPFSGVLP